MQPPGPLQMPSPQVERLVLERGVGPCEPQGQGSLDEQHGQEWPRLRRQAGLTGPVPCAIRQRQPVSTGLRGCLGEGDSTNGDESQVDIPAGGLNTLNWPTADPKLASSAGTSMSGSAGGYLGADLRPFPALGRRNHQGGVEPCPGRGIVRDLRRVYCRVGVTVHRRASNGRLI